MSSNRGRMEQNSDSHTERCLNNSYLSDNQQSMLLMQNEIIQLEPYSQSTSVSSIAYHDDHDQDTGEELTSPNYAVAILSEHAQFCQLNRLS